MIEFIYPIINYVLGILSGYLIFRALSDRKKRLYWKEFLKPVTKETSRDKKVRKLVTEFRRKNRNEQSNLIREWVQMITGMKHGLPLENFSQLVDDAGLDAEEIRNG